MYKKRDMIQHVLLPCLPVASALASAKPLEFLDAKPYRSRFVLACTCGLVSRQQTILDAVSFNSACCHTLHCLLSEQGDN